MESSFVFNFCFISKLICNVINKLGSKLYICMYVCIFIYTGLKIDGVASQNANHFGLIANHFGKGNRKTANRF